MRALVLSTLLFACGSSSKTATPQVTANAADQLRALVRPVTVETADDIIAELVGDRRVVLLGEPTHGTDEVYRARAEISLRLIVDAGFDVVAFEADWAAMELVDRYVRGLGSDTSAAAALGEHQRFPAWMWRNQAFAEFVEAVRSHNLTRPPAEQVRMVGMDLYGAVQSAAAVERFLAMHAPGAAEEARASYTCLARAVEFELAPGDESCARAVARPLADVEAFADRAGGFEALQNARVVVAGERYYRLAQQSSTASWNHRDRHMADTLAAIATQLAPERGEVKQLAWAHNSHVGDARATSLGEGGQLDLGQLARERWADATLLVGFTTYTGTVYAAPSWGDAGRVFDVVPARADSIEGVFHDVDVPAFALATHVPAVENAVPWLRERAIGVVYAPSTELQSHYFLASVAEQFDVVIHFDTTRAVTPL